MVWLGQVEVKKLDVITGGIASRAKDSIHITRRSILVLFATHWRHVTMMKVKVKFGVQESIVD